MPTRGLTASGALRAGRPGERRRLAIAARGPGEALAVRRTARRAAARLKDVFASGRLRPCAPSAGGWPRRLDHPGTAAVLADARDVAAAHVEPDHGIGRPTL